MHGAEQLCSGAREFNREHTDYNGGHVSSARHAGDYAWVKPRSDKKPPSLFDNFRRMPASSI